MKIVFDTNVLISAFLTTTGPSQYVLSRALRRHRVILSAYILNEFQEKPIKKLGMPRSFVREAMDFLKRRTHLIEPAESHGITFKDKKDIPILLLAGSSGAHYLVTGDKALLELKKYGVCTLIRPREAMEFL